MPSATWRERKTGNPKSICLRIDFFGNLEYTQSMAIVKKISNDVRSRASLRHPAIGTVEFGWDDEWVVVCFYPINQSMPLWSANKYTLFANRPMTVVKDGARLIWDDLIFNLWQDVP